MMDYVEVVAKQEGQSFPEVANCIAIFGCCTTPFYPDLNPEIKLCILTATNSYV